MKITRGQLQDLLAQRAVQKPKFRDMLIADPKGMVERVLGHSIDNVIVRAVVETPDTMYVVVPHVTEDGELSEGELEQIATGILDGLNAACQTTGGLNLLSSKVAIEMS